MNIWDELPKPFFVLAPMDDVTDSAFRQIIASTAPPDLYFTEFVNADGLQSPGRPKLMPKLAYSDVETPLIAQLWGKKPENYYKTARELAGMGYAGVDINMGCPVQTVIQNGCCAALINDRELALEIIKATQEGAGSLPVSVKTRLGFNEVDLSWHELLLKQKLNALTIHGRTKKQLSEVPADWHSIAEIRKLRDTLSPPTKIIGNGDVMTREQGLDLARRYDLDGIMIGRGIFQDPYIFAKNTPWQSFDPQKKLGLYKKHILLFAKTWSHGERKLHTLNKFCKIYVNGFDGAKELREKLMAAGTIEELMKIVNNRL